MVVSIVKLKTHGQENKFDLIHPLRFSFLITSVFVLLNCLLSQKVAKEVQYYKQSDVLQILEQMKKEVTDQNGTGQ